MQFSRRFGLFHLACLRWFAPRSVLAQSMRHQRSAGAPWPQLTPPMAGKLLKRRFEFVGCNVEMPVRITWQVAHASSAWHREFYGFRWIHELAASNNQKAASSFIREFINGMIVQEKHLHHVAWEPDVAGARVAMWMQYRSFILKGSSKAFRKRFGRSIIRHALVLFRACESSSATVGFAGVLGLLSLSSQISDMRFMQTVVFVRLQHLLAEDVLQDGTHASVSPEKHLDVLRTLIDIRFLLSPEAAIYHDVVRVIAMMGRALTFFCHGDGRLALFHDSLLADAGMIAAVRQLSSATDIASEWLPDAGFIRLEQQRTRVLMAVSPQADAQADIWPESRLAFELSDGSERIIVNCGAYRGNDVGWAKAVRHSQVYSGVTFDPASVQAWREVREPQVEPEAPIAEGADEALRGKAPRGDVKVHTGTSGIFAEACNEKVPAHYGMTHHRHLHLSRKGDVLSGRDILVLQGDGPPAFEPVLRFHLHPDIRCHRMKGGVVELKSVSGKGWHFSATSGIELQVSESVYLGYYGKPQKTLQIVLKPQIKTDKTMISWQFKRINVAATVEMAQAILLSETT